MFIETCTDAQPRNQLVHNGSCCSADLSRALYRSVMSTGLSNVDIPSSGYSRISSNPIAVTSTLKAYIMTCLATNELSNSEP
jgi:hypothetical protein